MSLRLSIFPVFSSLSSKIVRRRNQNKEMPTKLITTHSVYTQKETEENQSRKMEIIHKYFKKSSKVEVWSLEDGFQNAWFPAVIIQSPSSKKRRLSKNDNSKAVVIYDYMLDDEGNRPLVEKVDAFLLRPVPPSDTTADRQGFEPNDVVDAFYDDIWWTGVVLKVVNGKYTVFFKTPPDVLEFKRSELRPHWDWVAHKWVRPEKQALPESMFSPGTEVEVNLNTENTSITWFPAIALGEVGTSSMLVRMYKKSSNNGEKELLDKVTVPLEQIRPQPPEISSDNKFYDLMEKVDAFFDSGWSVGLITKILLDRKYVVTFKPENKLKEFNHFELRPHLYWIDGQWVTHSGELLFSSSCQEQSNHACSADRNVESPTLNESSGSTINDTEKGTPDSTNKQDNKKELSPFVDKSANFEISSKEIVNHTSNGDESTEVILIPDDEEDEISKRPLKTPRKDVGEGKNQALIPVRKRGRSRKYVCTIPLPRTPKRARSSQSKRKDLQQSVTVRGATTLKISDQDVFEPKHVIEEFEVSGMLVEAKGATGSHIENSGPPPTEGEQNNVGSCSKINGKGEQPELPVSNSQAAEAGEKLGGSGDVVPECATDKPNSPLTTGMELTDAPEDGRALASPTSTIALSASSMQIEETFTQTIANESVGTLEDGRALVFPTSTNADSTDKVLSKQIEEIPEDGRAVVSLTSTNIVYTDKALSMQIEGMLSPANIDELDALEDERVLVSSTSTTTKSTDKVLSMQIEETPADGRAQVSPTCTNVVPTDEALTMQIDETFSLTNVDESDAREDGRALVSPKSTNVNSTDKVLSMQIEETPEDGSVLVSPTSTSIGSTDKALSVQIVETPLTNGDESGYIEQEDTDLPFVKSSPIWKLIESMDVFKKFPQKPHFLPLVKCKWIHREAAAINNMINFAYLFEKTSKLQEGDSREYFDAIVEEVPKLEELGFNVKVVQDHLNEWLQKKARLEELQNELKEVEVQIMEHTDNKTKLDGEVAEIDKEIKRLEEGRAILMLESADRGSIICKLLSEAANINEVISCTRQSFGNRI